MTSNEEEKRTIKVPDACDVLHIREKEKEVFQLFTDIFQLYKPDEVMLSFNGGKDCTVLLHLLSRYYQSKCLQHVCLPVLYIHSEDMFEEIEDFVDQCAQLYHINLIKLEGGIKTALRSLCNEMPQMKAVFMGSRRTDPHCETLRTLHPTDPEWPELMRISPLLDWTCRDIWSYIFTHEVPYCSLYDHGYTSLGNKKNTKPNPHLRVIDPFTNQIMYRPAYEMMDNDALERAGRCTA